MKVYFYVTIALCAAACAKAPQEPDKSIVFEHHQIVYNYRMAGSADAYQTDADLYMRDSASLIMPASVYGLETRPLYDSIVSFAFDTVAPLPEAFAAYSMRLAAESGFDPVPEDSVAVAEPDGLAIITAEVFNLTPRILTYRIEREAYLPHAAHGMSLVKYLTYSLESNQIVSLSNLFTQEGLQQLPAIIYKRAQKLRAIIGATDPITALPVDGNFYIGLDNAITFVYQPYEVASYAQGVVNVTFYSSDLTELLTPLGRHLFDLE